MRLAELNVVRTNETCVSYRLRVLGRIVWSNRAYADVPESHAAVRRRMEAWAAEHGYRVSERKEEPQQRRA